MYVGEDTGSDEAEEAVLDSSSCHCGLSRAYITIYLIGNFGRQGRQKEIGSRFQDPRHRN
jgi:hypothetical protein